MASNCDALRVSGSVQGSFKSTWNVKNFSSLDSQVGKCHCSDTFRLKDGGMEWSLSLYPGGETKNSKGFVSCFVYLESKIKNVQLKYDISLFNTKYELLVSLKSENWLNLMTTGYGNSNFIETQNVLSKLIDDTLVIVLDMIYCTNYIKDGDGVCQYAETTPMLNFADDLRKLWVSKKDADCSMLYDGVFFHSPIVSARSKYFEYNWRGFKRDHKPKQSITGDIGCAINSFVEFIYTGNVHRMNFRLALELLQASEILETSDLKLFCSNYLISVLNDDNVCETLLKADEYKAEKLRSHAIKYLCKNLTEEGFEAKRLVLGERPELLRDITKEFDTGKENSKLAL